MKPTIAISVYRHRGYKNNLTGMVTHIYGNDVFDADGFTLLWDHEVRSETKDNGIPEQESPAPEPINDDPTGVSPKNP